MTVVDLHPEHLLDRELRGELDAAERERLEAHLEQCATCRLERRMRADFELELERDSVPPDVANLVESLARRPTETPAAPPTRRARRRVVVLLAAATLTLVASAFASTEGGRRALAPLFGRATAPAPTYVDSPAAPVQASRVAVKPSTARSADPAPSSDAPVAVETPPPVPPAAAAPVAAPAAAPRAESAASLFDEESAARRSGDTARVLELHAQLTARFPASREAQVSRMMVARLLLARGDAAGALAAFDSYLRTGSGELREDALAGRATALDRLGRTEDARRAWLALLDQYPGTAFAPHARARIEAAGGN